MKKMLTTGGFILFFLLIFGLLIYAKTLPFFTVVVLPDTQLYTMYYPQIVTHQTEWIVNHKEKLNIVFVSQLGDLVQSGNHVATEWHTISTALRILENANIAFSIIPGNHDTDTVDDPNSAYNEYSAIFPTGRFDSKAWFGGNFRDYQNNYQLITAGEKKLLILNLEVDPDDDVLQWANQVLTQHQDRKVILTTHAYLKDDTGQRSTTPHFREAGNSGEELWNRLITKHCSIFLVLSAHFHMATGENYLASTNSCGDTVHQLVQDYQGRESGGNGLLRLLTFYPTKKLLTVKTFSTETNQFETDRNSQFTLNVSLE